jgi:hypothetical protein
MFVTRAKCCGVGFVFWWTTTARARVPLPGLDERCPLMISSPVFQGTVALTIAATLMLSCSDDGDTNLDASANPTSATSTPSATNHTADAAPDATNSGTPDSGDARVAPSADPGEDGGDSGPIPVDASDAATDPDGSEPVVDATSSSPNGEPSSAPSPSTDVNPHLCNDVELADEPFELNLVHDEAPTPTGGSIEAGTYDLVERTRIVTPAAEASGLAAVCDLESDAHPYRWTLRVSNVSASAWLFEDAYADDASDAVVRTSWTVEIDKSGVGLAWTVGTARCTSVEIGGVEQPDRFQYNIVQYPDVAPIFMGNGYSFAQGVLTVFDAFAFLLDHETPDCFQRSTYLPRE